MAVLRELKKRINTVKSTRKITKAMKMVAASKLRKATELRDRATVYHNELEKSLVQVTTTNKLSEREVLMLFGKKNINKHLFIIGGAEKGLCGGFNSNLIKCLTETVQDKNNCLIICLNTRIYSALKTNFKDNIIDVLENTFSKTILYKDAKDVAEKVLNYFHSNAIGSCSIIYSKFHSILTQEAKQKSLIPFNIEQSFQGLQSSHFEYEPEINQVLEELLRKNIENQIFYALLENNLSEQGARMNAMDNATRNADKMIKNLTLQYNRSRQANITKELIEIISGSEVI